MSTASGGNAHAAGPEASNSQWNRFYSWLQGVFSGADPGVCIAFWLFGLINNVLYVILLSAALDLVGPNLPKGIVLLADIIPSFTTKLIAPYFIHAVPYSTRVLVFVALSILGMVVVAVSPSYEEGGSFAPKVVGIVLASLSAGGGELSFVGLTHFYGPFSLAAWGSGTGAAGLVGAGAYALATSAMGISVRGTLFASACLPVAMAMSFFAVLPRDPLRKPKADRYVGVERGERYEAQEDEEEEEAQKLVGGNADLHGWERAKKNLSRLKKLFFPFMLPLLVVFIAEYVINQGVAPTLLFPLPSTPFENFRSFYPTYNAIYQAGVFISRSSTPFFRIHWLYVPSLLQAVNLAVLTLHAMFNFIPSVYIVFAIIFWEGLLGGAVYVNTFAEIGERVPEEEREFSLGATTVSDSAGICIAGFLNKHGPPFIRSISSRLSSRLTTWQTTVIIFLWLYVCRNFAKIVGLECPEPLANLYSRSFFRATWITTGLDAGYWTAMTVKPKWLRDIASLVFTVYYLIAAEQADEKVRRVRATLTLEHLRVSWNKATTSYLWTLASLMRPRLTKYGPRAIRIPRPAQSVHKEPVDAWLYFDGPLSALKDQKAMVLDIPGGGFVAMGPRCSEDKLLSWAGQLKVPILSVDYKKAPEYAYPYALHECMSGATCPRIVVTGESAGGNLAVGTTLMVIQSGLIQGWKSEEVLPRPIGLVLAYPTLNMRVESWMTDEQMSLIQDKSSRQTNQGILQRKKDQYRKLTPFTSPGHSVEDLTKLASPEPTVDSPDIASEAAKALEDKLKKNKALNGDVEDRTGDQVQPLKTQLAVSSMISYVHDRIITPEMMRAMIILYIGPHQRPDFNTDFFLSPVLAPDALLAAFPKTFIMAGERDPLVDDTVIFAGRLRQAKLHQFYERQELGLEKQKRQFREKDYVEVSLIPGVSHGFIQMAGFFPEAWKYINRSAQWIDTLFQTTEGDDAEFKRLRASHASKKEERQRTLLRHLEYAKGLRNHHRSFTGESSGDEDRPLEMSMTKLNPSERLTGRPKKRRSPFSSSRLGGFTTVEDESAKGTDLLMESQAQYQDTFHQDELHSAPESPDSLRPRGRSITSLGSEEDLLDRRMNGVAGGLMGGMGERAQTPGP
ncbi:hypothetical protein N7468_008391 [Penicillium chermesinum]|uniref:Alpha/beta hydrolase fold-3 domain-containing protein n=1 Tax=Penicillium chermesinum TaxID=63820 RepID=A0A9W9TIL6_9EURO|nr:uncharacterized protein N7468_008391 [Penicillium chermesinum]KAJ5223849.1 hypothetical protein N7468_008391 [Penicillium chermesinum]